MKQVSMPIALAAAIERPARPYPGLRPFNAAEWSIFCGREEASREVLYMLGEHGVVLVHGGSGCGKSSLISAGVLPSLQRDMELAGARLAYATIRPSQGPLGALATTLAGELGDCGKPSGYGAIADWTTALTVADAGQAAPRTVQEENRGTAGDKGILGRIEAAIAERGLDLFCLVIDQFEEVFAWQRDNGTADVEALCRLLAARAASRQPSRFVIILTMRSDFLGQCSMYPLLGSVINRCQFFVPGLTEFERAIREPALMFGGSVGDPLVTRLITDTISNVDALPALQHALMRMAEPKLAAGAESWELTLDDYYRVTTHKGVEVPAQFLGNALSVHAEEVLDSLCAGGKSSAKAVEMVFRALTAVDAAGHLVRRPTDRPALRAMAGGAEGEVDAVVDAYAASGVDLLHLSIDPVRKVEIVDISHEALLRNWWRMWSGPRGIGPGWIQAEADDALTWQTLARLAAIGEELKGQVYDAMRQAFQAFERSPERVRRYLVHDERRCHVIDEHEWQLVAGLMRRSKRSAERRKAVLRGTFAVMTIGMAMLTWHFRGEVIGLLVQRQVMTRTAELGQKTKQAQDEASQIISTSEASTQRLQSENRELAAANAQLIASAQKIVRDRQQTGQVLTPDYQALLQSVSTVEHSPSPGQVGGYIVLGGGGSTNLLASEKGPVLDSPSQVRPRATYVVAKDLTLRVTVPDRNNVALRAGALKAGTPVTAAEAPVRAPNGLYYLKVVPNQTGTVYLQYASGDPAQRLSQLVATGFKTPPAQKLPVAAGLYEVRYCWPGDRVIAERAATALALKNGSAVGVRPIGGGGACQRISKRGTVEAWIGEP